MASSYTTNFGIEEMAAGDQTGAWGDTTNFNFDILDRIAAYKAVALSDAATATLTVREASPGTGTENLQDGMFRVIKFTGSLAQNCTVTIAPDTTTAWFIIENATTDTGSSGPYSLLMKQGSGGGASVTIQNGKNAIIYCDGAGSGAVVTNALSDLQIATLECTGAAAIDGALTLGTDLSVANGGTGASSLTDGGVLLGSGTGAITAMAALADGEMIVGDGTTDPVAESGATLRTSIGLGTFAVENVNAVPAQTLAGAVTGADQTVSAINLKDYGEVTNAIGSTGGGTQDIDLTLGNNVVATVDTSANTFTFSNPTASDELCGFTLFLTNGGSQTVNWPGTVDWAGGTAPTLTTSGIDILVFITTDGGTIWHGMVASADSKSPS
tara:strand:+ start:71 stop:1222 length:1152 start_codon:yes stop_codon:yes gene_type:complete